MSELPAGWSETSLSDLTDARAPICYGVLKPGERDEALVPMVRVTDIRGDILERSKLMLISSQLDEEFSRSRIRGGDVLLSIQGTVGRVAVVPDDMPAANISRTIARIRPSSSDLSHWLWVALRTPQMQEAMRAETGGTTRDSLNIGALRDITLPLPPLAEQRRIATKVDALLARTARARADLDRIPALAARFKEAVLAKAFSGDLTAEWRKAADNAKPWQEVSIGEIAAITSGFGFPKDRQGLSEGDYPFAKVSDISKAVTNDGGMLSSAANYVRKADLQTLRAKPVPAGSVVFAKIGEALRLNRRALATTEVILDNNCMALSPDVSRVAPRFLYQFMKTVDLSPFAVATAVPSIRRGDVANLRLPLPPLNEQVEIDHRVEVAFVEIDRLTAEAASARRLLDHLDQAVLAKVFRGELLPQDPTDEPASVLLDRIKAEREEEGRKPKSRRERKPTGSKEQAMNGKPLPPRERILKDSENWPVHGLPFEAIATRNAMPHDQLRDALFELLAGPSPALQQRFDGDAEVMVIQRVAA